MFEWHTELGSARSQALEQKRLLLSYFWAPG